MKTPHLVMILAAAVGCCGVASAEEVKRASSLPSGLADAVYQKLLDRKNELDATQETLTKLLDDFNADCSDVPSSDAEQVRQCTDGRRKLLSRIKQYNLNLARHEKDIRDAQNEQSVSKDPAADQAAAELMKQRLAVLRSRAKAFAAWRLGAYLLGREGHKDKAVSYLQEARRFFADPDSHENDALSRLMYDPSQQEPGSFIHDMFPVYGSRADALLDALEYGNGDWDKSLEYLTVAHEADPNDLAVRDAYNYLQGMAPGESDKQP